MRMGILKRRFVFGSLLFGLGSAALLGGTALAATGGPSTLGVPSLVAAQTATSTAATPAVKQTLLSRVATILGKDAAAVEAAAKAANKEIGNEDLKTALDAAVTAGKITQAQADSYYTWYTARPDDIPEFLAGKGRFRLPKMKGPVGQPQTPDNRFATKVSATLGITVAAFEAALKQAEKQIADEQIKAQLDRMVAAGKLTQAQADAYFQWLQARPEGIPGNLSGILPGIGGKGGPHGRGHDMGRGPMMKPKPGHGAPVTPKAPAAPATTGTIL